MAATEFQDQASLEALALYARGQFAVGRRVPLGVRRAVRIDQFHAQHQPPATDIPQLRIVRLQALQVPAQALPHGLGMVRQAVLDQVFEHGRPCGHGHLVAAEGAGMGARLPGVEPVAVHHHGQGQAATDGFGQGDYVWDDTGVFEGEHAPGTGEAALDFIDDQRDARLLGDAPYALEPLDVGGYHAAFALHHFQNHRCWQRHPAFGVEQQVFQVVQVGLNARLAAQAEWAAIVVGVRHELHAAAQQCAQGLLGTQAPHQAECPLAHAVVGALEGQDRAASGGAAHQLERRFHRIGTGRATELHLGFTAQCFGQYGEQVLDEAVLDRGGQVQGVQGEFIGQHALDGFDHHGVVMAQRQRTGPGQAVDELAAFDVLDIDATGSFEGQRDTAGVATGIGFLLLLAVQQRGVGEFVQGMRGGGRWDLSKAGSGGHGESSQASEWAVVA